MMPNVINKSPLIQLFNYLLQSMRALSPKLRRNITFHKAVHFLCLPLWNPGKAGAVKRHSTGPAQKENEPKEKRNFSNNCSCWRAFHGYTDEKEQKSTLLQEPIHNLNSFIRGAEASNSCFLRAYFILNFWAESLTQLFKEALKSPS
jgi:hypothetical protein